MKKTLIFLGGLAAGAILTSEPVKKQIKALANKYIKKSETETEKKVDDGFETVS